MSAIVSTKAAGGTLRIKYTITGTDAVTAGTRLNCKMTWDAALPDQDEIIIPTSEFWMFTDLYAPNGFDAQAGNPEVEFYKDADRILDRSQPAETVLVNLNSRPNGLHGNLQYEGGSHLTCKVVLTEDTAASKNGDYVLFAPYEKRG